jgi:serine/threonine protein kinase
MPFVPGSQVGPYEVVSQLGAGGMGEVYRAADRRLRRDVAVKVIRRALVNDETALDRLLREATLASSLNHPNIVTIYETGVVGSDRYIAMELVEGSTLRALWGQGLPLGRAIAIARQIAEALAVAHAAEIVHRDIKPDNVMVRPDGYVKLLDFGLARLREDPVRAAATGPVTEAGLILGTVAYMAPEQARGEAVNPEADVFALGVLLYELVTGRHPFAAASQVGTLHALMRDNPEPPSRLNPELPRSIDQLILEALQKDPRLRPGASEVMFRLNLAHDSAVAMALSSVTVTPGKPSTSPNVVGRELELDSLLDEFDRAQRGGGRLVVVSGEAGVGKTTLIETFGISKRAARLSAWAADAVRNAWPAAKRICRFSRRSTAFSAASSLEAYRGSFARWRRAGTRRSCRLRRTIRPPRVLPPTRSADRRSGSSSRSARCSKSWGAFIPSCCGSTTSNGRIRRQPI